MTLSLNSEQVKLVREIMHEYQGFAPSSPRGREKRLAEQIEKLCEAKKEASES